MGVCLCSENNLQLMTNKEMSIFSAAPKRDSYGNYRVMSPGQSRGRDTTDSFGTPLQAYPEVAEAKHRYRRFNQWLSSQHRTEEELMYMGVYYPEDPTKLSLDAKYDKATGELLERPWYEMGHIAVMGLNVAVVREAAIKDCSDEREMWQF